MSIYPAEKYDKTLFPCKHAMRSCRSKYIRMHAFSRLVYLAESCDGITCSCVMQRRNLIWVS